MGCTCTWITEHQPSAEASSLVLTIRTLSDSVKHTEPLQLSNRHLHNALTIPKDRTLGKTSKQTLPVWCGQLTENPQSTLPSVELEAEVVLEEGLMKYWPGYSRDYSERWCQLTSTTLVYYASHFKAALTVNSPLDSVPLTDIKFVSKVSLPSTRTVGNYHFAFEIFLRQERAGTDFKHLTLRDPHKQLKATQRGQRLVFCTSSERSRNAWIKAFADQLEVALSQLS